jgi:hypothetical protein
MHVLKQQLHTNLTLRLLLGCMNYEMYNVYIDTFKVADITLVKFHLTSPLSPADSTDLRYANNACSSSPLTFFKFKNYIKMHFIHQTNVINERVA